MAEGFRPLEALMLRVQSSEFISVLGLGRKLRLWV